MPMVAKVSRATVEMKPKHGDACNRCGLCCEVSLCPTITKVLGIEPPPGIGLPGPCPALRGEPGAASCGLVETPEEWMPVRTYALGRPTMGAAARLLINAGDGCDCRVNGEPNNDVFDEYLARLDVARASQIRRAKRLWQIDGGST